MPIGHHSLSQHVLQAGCMRQAGGNTDTFAAVTDSGEAFLPAQVSYLSLAPQGVSEVLLTGGLPPCVSLPCSAPKVYSCLYRSGAALPPPGSLLGTAAVHGTHPAGVQRLHLMHVYAGRSSRWWYCHDAL